MGVLFDYLFNITKARGVWWRFLTMTLPVIGLMVIISYFFLQSEQQSHLSSVRLEAAHHIESQAKNIREEIKRAVLDVKFLSKHSEVVEVLKGDDAHALEELNQDFHAFAKYMGVYHQVRLLNQRGLEVVRADFSDGDAALIATEDLQDKSAYPYFTHAINALAQFVFISKFTLNIEHGEIERPFNPVIRYSAPVQGDDGENIGVVVLNFRGRVLIDRYLDATDVKGENMLLNANSFFIHAEDDRSTWGSILQEREGKSMAERFPDIWDDIIDHRFGQILTARGLFTYETISPYALTDQIKPLDAGAGDWIIVSYVSGQELYMDANHTFRLFVAASIVLLFLWVVLAWQWSFSEMQRENVYLKLSRMHKKQRYLLRRQMNMQEEERRILARTLHDDLGQSLTSIQAYAVAIAKKVRLGNYDKVDTGIQNIRDITTHIQQSVRSHLRDLRPASLDRLGLSAALEDMLDEFARREVIQCRFLCERELPELSEHMNIHLFRIVQESLTNVAKHARSEHVEVSLILSTDVHDGVDSLLLQIVDDGCGMVNIEESGLGLLGMRERTELLGGVIHIESELGHGVKINVHVRLQEQQ